LSPGNDSDIKHAAALIGSISAPENVLADKAYDADELRKNIELMFSRAVIPLKKTESKHLNLILSFTRLGTKSKISFKKSKIFVVSPHAI
jgi:hypothetical protein